MIAVYALCDPDSAEIRYIGKTNDLCKRMVSHCTGREMDAVSYKRNWIKSLLNKGKKPTMIVLGWVEAEEANRAEIAAIFWARRLMGDRLTNTTIGGDGGRTIFTEEARDRWRKNRAWYKPTEETKRKQKEGIARFWASDRGELEREVGRKRCLDQGLTPPHTPGEKNGFAKLNEAQVLNIRAMRAEGYLYKDIAAKFNMSVANICDICLRKRWKHI